jgi:hypothetical protein
MEIQFDTGQSLPISSEGPKEMLSVSQLPSGKTKVRVNFSSLSLMQECWRKTEYSLVRGLRSNLESPATLFGSAIHKGLEVFYSGSRSERVIPVGYSDTMAMIGCGSWQPEWAFSLLFRAAQAFVARAAALSALPPDNKRSIATGAWMLQHYFLTYINDPWVVLCDEQGPITERKFSLPIYEAEDLEIEGFGQIDVILRNEQTGVILAADHKTTSMLGTQFYQRLNPNHQYTFYTMAAREVFGLQTNSFLVNALQVKEKPKTARGSVPDFARQVTTRTEEDFTELRSALMKNVREFLFCLEEGYFPQTAPGPCSNYGGCQYLDICSAPAQLRETIIKARFQEKT